MTALPSGVLILASLIVVMVVIATLVSRWTRDEQRSVTRDEFHAYLRAHPAIKQVTRDITVDPTQHTVLVQYSEPGVLRTVECGYTILNGQHGAWFVVGDPS